MYIVGNRVLYYLEVFGIEGVILLLSGFVSNRLLWFLFFEFNGRVGYGFRIYFLLDILVFFLYKYELVYCVKLIDINNYVLFRNRKCNFF